VEQWRKGTKQGDFKIYYSNGQLFQEGKYTDGKLHGSVYQYNQEKLRYRMGVLRKGKERKARKEATSQEKSVKKDKGVGARSNQPGIESATPIQEQPAEKKRVRKKKKAGKQDPHTLVPVQLQPFPVNPDTISVPKEKKRERKRWFSKKKADVPHS